MRKDKVENPEGIQNHDDHYRKIINQLTDAVLEELARSNPTKPLISDCKNHIKQRLHGFFPNFQTPTHPTYSVMIYRAITELQKEGGSSEEAISDFIKHKFDDLPWAHASMLRHHLKKLSHSGEIIAVSEKCYMLPDENTNSVIKTEQGSKQKKKREQRRGKKRQHVTKHGDQSQGQMVKKQKQFREQDFVLRKQDKVQGFQKKIDDQNQSLEQQIKQTGEGRQEELEVGFSNKQCPAGEQQIEVEENQNQAQILEYEDEMEERQVEVKERNQGEGNEVEDFEGIVVARRHELEETGGKSLLQDQQIVEQKQKVSCEPVKSGEIDVDEECNQVELPQVERICDLKQAKRQSEAIDSQSQAETQLTKENKENVQQSEEFLNTLSGRQIEVFEDQMPAQQQFEVIEEQKEAPVQAVKGHENSEQNGRGQKIRVTQKLIERNGRESKMINKQTDKQHNEVIKDQSQSSFQQIQQEDEGYEQPMPTQGEEIAVGVLQKNKAKLKDTVTEEQRQEADEQEQYRIKEKQNKMAQGQKQVGDIERKLQLQEEQIENLSKLPRQHNEVIGETNKQLQILISQIDLSKMQELLLKKQGKEAHATASNPSSTTKISDSGGSSTLKEKCLELLKKRKEIEEELFGILNLFSVRAESNHSSREPIGGVEELQLQIESPCRDSDICDQNKAFNSQPKAISASPELPLDSLQLRGIPELCSQQQTSEPLPVKNSVTTSVNLVMRALEREREVPKLESNPQLKSSTVVQAIATSPHDPITSVDELHHAQKHLKQGGEDPSIVVFSPAGEKNDPEKQKPQSKGQKQLLRPMSNPEATAIVSGLLDNQNHNLEMQQQPKKVGRGRPRKLKFDAENTTGDKLISQPKKDGRGRPRKQKLDAEATFGDKLISKNKQKRRGRPSKQKLNANTTTGDVLISQKKQDAKRRGRPSKQKLNADTTTGDVLISQNKQDVDTPTGDILMLQKKQNADTPTRDILIQKQQEQRGRLTKRKLNADTTTGDILMSQNQQKQPMCQGPGRQTRVTVRTANSVSNFGV